MTVRALPVVLAVALVAGCGSGGTRGGGGTVTSGGRIGALRIDVSTVADVLRIAGRPDDTVTRRTDWPGVPPYHALGYGCSHEKKPTYDPAAPLAPHVVCQSVYYVNTRTRRLAAFWTDSPSFRTVRGTTPAMKQPEANRREQATPGGPWFAMGKGMLLILSTCKSEAPGRCVGETVGALALESRHDPVGLLFT